MSGAARRCLPEEECSKPYVIIVCELLRPSEVSARTTEAVMVQNHVVMVAERCSATDPYQSERRRARRPNSDDDGDYDEGWLVLDVVSQRWRRLVRSVQRIRRLQRIWGNLGQFLQLVAEKGLRERLRRTL